MKLTKSTIILALAFLPFFSTAQTELPKGISFETGSSWDQIKAKAKAENKYIFMDCYATWCVPCKEMDNTVYTSQKVGEIIDKEFIAVKVQMDKSSADNDEIKNRYNDANTIRKRYKIAAFPTYLFFSPDGKLVHRDEALKTRDQFIDLLHTAVDPNKQLYTLLDNYRKGKINSEQITYLGTTLQKFDPKQADSVADTYIGSLNQQGQPLALKTTIEFISRFPRLLYTNRSVWELFYHHRKLADSIDQAEGFSASYINTAINAVQIDPEVYASKHSGAEPDWPTISKSICNKFDIGFAQPNVLNARVNWYKDKKDWENYAKYLVLENDVLGFETMDESDLNNGAWKIFLYSKNQKYLKKALSWCEASLKKCQSLPAGRNRDVDIAVFRDTKANLLYKLARKKEAIQLESQIVMEEPAFHDAAIGLEKMKKGIPTW